MKTWLILLAALATFTVSAEPVEHKIAYQEQAVKLRTVEGTSYVCLNTGKGFGWGDSTKVKGLTCTVIGKPIAWQFCSLYEGSLVCLPPGVSTKPG